jgi:hypothetical protein
VLGTLDAGSQFSNVDSGLMTPYTPPPDGCYFLTVALEEFDGTQYNYVDLVTFASGADGVPDPGGSGSICILSASPWEAAPARAPTAPATRPPPAW